MDEPDLMFLDIRSMLFYALCVGAFLLGVLLADRFFWSPSFIDKTIETCTPTTAPILIPLLVALALNAASIITVIRNGELVSLLLSGEGDAVKQAIGAEGSLVLTGTALMGVSWWAIWRYQQLRIRGISGWITRVLICLAVVSTIASATLKLGRGEVMPIFVGLAIIILLRQIVRNEIRRRGVLIIAGLSFVLITAFFVWFAVLRGAAGPDEIAGSFIAYTIASYNRSAALLSGHLQFPYAGTGVYLSRFLAFNNLFNRLIPIRELANWPTFYAEFMSEFWAVWHAGLNGNSIWPGTFGYIFLDLGWFSPIFVFVHGLLSGWAWRSIRLGRVFGLIVYPWCAFCILFWVGLNGLFGTELAVLTIVAIAIGGYEALLSRQTVLVAHVARHILH